MKENISVVESCQVMLFDLGGVLLDIDFKATAEAFAKLGVTNIGQYVNQSFASYGVFGQFERGLISPKEFFDGVRKITNISASNELITNAWNAMLGNYRPEAIRIIERLKAAGRTTALLSNTNVLHYENFDRRVPGYASLDNLLDHVWYSFGLHMSKPNEDVFRAVIDALGCPPSSVAFFDDAPANVEAAAAVGINAFRVSPEMPLERYIII